MEFPKKAFMPFVVLGDPDYKQSVEIIKTLIDNGARALELGFAFSDPIADGPVIQKANKRSLDSKIRSDESFHILEEIRDYSSIPISLMVSYNIVLSYGVERFYRKCREVGIEALLCPEITYESSEEVVRYAKENNINQIFIISFDTSEERMKKYKGICSGYVYLVSSPGTTGVREEVNKTLPDVIKKAKENIGIPVYVGFGVSKPKHVSELLGYGADGVICGSAICDIIERNLEDYEKMKQEIGNFCSEMSNIK